MWRFHSSIQRRVGGWFNSRLQVPHILKCHSGKTLHHHLAWQQLLSEHMNGRMKRVWGIMNVVGSTKLASKDDSFCSTQFSVRSSIFNVIFFCLVQVSRQCDFL